MPQELSVSKAIVRRLHLIGGIAACLVVVAACGGNDDQPDGSTTPTPSITQPSETAPDSPAAGTSAKLGEPFDLPITYADGQATFRVTVESVTPTTKLDQKILDEYNTSAPVPPGNKWIVVKFTVTNTGHSQASWDTSTTELAVGADRYSQTQAAGEASDHYNSSISNSGGNTSAFEGLNPKVTGTTYGIWDIPADAKPTALHIATVMGTANVTESTPRITVDLR